jgi:hypothetical protein
VRRPPRHDHPQILTSRDNLAYAYRAAGDLDRAIPLNEQTLADSVRVLGVGHPQTKIVRGSTLSSTRLASCCREAAGLPKGRKYAASDLG